MSESRAQAGVSAIAPGPDGREVKRPMRPRELQDALNHYLYHPLAWQLARRLARTPITPNMVSVLGACFVIAAAVVYLQPAWLGRIGLGLGWPWAALLGMTLHMTWHVVDGADGDLARLTGRTSPIGEMVDGLCDYLSHVVIYVVLGGILSRSMGGHGWAWMWAAGISHIIQANHVEVQRRQYQWWVYGTSWLRMEHKAGSATGDSLFGGLVSLYLGLATGLTPYALKIDAAVAAANAGAAEDPERREAIRSAVRAEAGPLLRLCKVLGPNPRAIVLGISMLAGGPLWYFVYLSVALNVLLVASVILHNRAAHRIAERIGV